MVDCEGVADDEPENLKKSRNVFFNQNIENQLIHLSLFVKFIQNYSKI